MGAIRGLAERIREKGVLRTILGAACRYVLNPLRRTKTRAYHRAVWLRVWGTHYARWGVHYARRFCQICRNIIISPWSIAIGLFLIVARVRFLPVMTECLGHLAIEPDCFVKEGILGRRRKYRGVIPGAPGAPPDECRSARILGW